MLFRSSCQKVSGVPLGMVCTKWWLKPTVCTDFDFMSKTDTLACNFLQDVPDQHWYETPDLTALTPSVQALLASVVADAI